MWKRISDTLAFSFWIFVVFFFLPMDLYGRNAQSFGNDTWLVHAFFAFGAVLVAACALPILLGVKFPRPLIWSGFGIGAAILFTDVFSPVQLKALDGAATTSPEPVIYTAIELALAAVIGFAIVKHYRSGRSSAIFAVLSLCLLTGIAITYASLAPAPPTTVADATPQGLTYKPTNGRGNIYHFHLDELQTDYLIALIQKGEWEQDFSGFTLFRRNISNYPYTQASVTSYLTSTLYTSGNYADWVATYDTGVFKSLANAAYSVDVIGLPETFKTSVADHLQSPETIFKETYKLDHPQLVQFTSLWLAKALPNLLTNEALVWGTSLGAELSQRLDREAQVPQTVGTGMHPFQARTALEYLINTEQRKPATGRYQFIQAILPHSPYIFDSSCRSYRGPRREAQLQYADQAACGLNLVRRFIDELKRLGRFDDSLILIQSDHGAGWVGFLDESDGGIPRLDGPAYGRATNVFGGTQRALESRSMAALMIKPAKSSGTLKVTDAKSQLLDIYPTIADAAGLPQPASEGGMSLLPCIQKQDCDAVNSRTRTFYVFPTTTPANPLFANRVVFKDGKPQFEKIEEVRVTQPATH